MTGPEHYRQAERLLRGIKAPGGAVVVDSGTAEVIAAAQVHATLAAAAAQALKTVGEWYEIEQDAEAWCKATTVYPAATTDDGGEQP